MDNSNQYAPVVVFVYKRLLHTQKVLEALDQNVLAKESELFIFADGYKGEQDKDAVKSVREYLHQYKKQSNYKKVYLTEFDYNRGLATSVISGVTEVIKKYGKVIVVEDDLITSRDFLMFMNEALDYYRQDDRVWSIAGYTPNLKGLKKYDKDIYVCLRAGSWGWATWQDRWESIDWDVKDYNLFVCNKRMRKEFGKRGEDMPVMLDMQMRGEIDSWAIRFCYEQFKQNKVTINPTISRIRNIGIDGSGTHKVNEKKWDVICNSEMRKNTFTPAEIDVKMIKQYYNFWFGNRMQRLYRGIKGIIYRILVKARQLL